MRSASHTTRRVSGKDWHIRESGPSDAESTVLLLPGGMCTAVFFEPIMDALAAAPVHVVAATLPGFGGTPHPAGFPVESYASLVAQVACELGADIVGGHSLGGNVALEMAARGEFDGMGHGRLVLVGARGDQEVWDRYAMRLCVASSR